MKGKDIMADILIIEDEEPIRELIKMHLSLAGHSYVEAKRWHARSGAY